MKLEKFYTLLNSSSINEKLQRSLKCEFNKTKTVQVEKCFYLALKRELSLDENKLVLIQYYSK